MEEIQKLTKIVENYFRETKIRSFRATKINRNQGLIFKDNYCQIRFTYYARKKCDTLPNLLFFIHIW